MKPNTLILLFCILILLLGNIRVLNKLKKSINKKAINLSSIWKIGLLIFLTGIITTLFTFSNIYDLIGDKTDINQITPLIKENLISAIKFLFLSIFSILNWSLLKKFR